MRENDKKEDEKYKLYKSVREILHPAISKKNISNYKIILKEELLPIRIYYQKKVTNLEKVIVYVQGSKKVIKDDYSKILSSLSKDLDRMVISIDYDDEASIEEQIKSIYETFKYIYDGLNTNGLDTSQITLVGDSTGSTLILNFIDKMKKDKIEDVKLLLFYPALVDNNKVDDISPIDYEIVNDIKKYYQDKIGKNNLSIADLLNKKYSDNDSFPNTLIICGNVDPLLGKIKELDEKIDSIDLKLVSFASHNFLKSKDKEIIKEYKSILNDFFKEENYS